MGFQSGLGAAISAAVETTYGTYVAPNRHFEFRNEQIKLDRQFVRSRQLKGGRMFQTSTRRVPTTRAAAGPASMEVPTKQFGIFINQLHGNVVTPVQQSATIAYLQTHDVGTTDPSSKSMSLQVQRPGTDGTTRAFSYLGSKLVSATFKWSLGDFLVCDLQFDCRDEDTAQSLVTYAVAAGVKSFDQTQGSILVDGVAAGVVTGFEIPIQFGYATGRFGLGDLVKNVPITNDYPTIEPKIDVEWKDMTLYNKFVNGTISTVVIDFLGAIIASTFKEEIKFDMQAVGFLGDTPTADGPDILTQSIPLEVLDNGTNPPLRILYQSTDVTL